MTNREMKAAFRKIPEVIFNTGDVGAADEIIATDYIEHIPLPPGLTPDLEGFKRFVVMWRTAVPDLHYTVIPLIPDDLVGEGDKVVHRVVGRGTHSGELFGIAPTGNTLEWTETHIGRFAHGKLVEHWGQIDLLRLLQQLGAIPVAPVPATATM